MTLDKTLRDTLLLQLCLSMHSMTWDMQNNQNRQIMTTTIKYRVYIAFFGLHVNFFWQISDDLESVSHY